ncbi:MAG: ATP-dependent helicase [Mycoplasmoidaceae bacterium]
MSQFNDKQKLGINANESPTIIIAGAGSGKTLVLTERILFLISKYLIPPTNILAFTFTNKAANEIKRRILARSASSNFKWIGTFHSICLKILKEDSHFINIPKNFILIDDEDQLSIIREIFIKNNFSKDIISIKDAFKMVKKIKSLKINSYEEITNYLDEKSISDSKEIITKCYFLYITHLSTNNYLDFDDLILKTIFLLKNNKQVIDKWKSFFKYILVDEFQDTNEDQFELIKLLSQKNKNIFVVGDPDQMIYSWRGAHQNIFNDFKDYYTNYKMIILEENYRSSPNILNVSNELIKNNKNRIEKKLFTRNIKLNNVQYYNANSNDEESKWIMNKIEHLINEKKYLYSDIAILYRSNSLSRNIEQFLFRRNIPYIIFGGLKFYKRKEIKDIIAYLRYIIFEDDIALSRIYNIPKRRFSEKTYEKIIIYAQKNNVSIHYSLTKELSKINEIKGESRNACLNFINLINLIKNYKYVIISDLIDYIIQVTKYEEYLKSIDQEHRLENLTELKNSIISYQIDNPNNTISDYLQEISLYTDSEEKILFDKYVTLSTVHSSKGLEFKNVFIIGFNEDLFPSFRSLNEDGIEEERRIAYVAMTRAKENLFISSNSGINYQNSKIKTPSRFLNEIKNSTNLEIVNNHINYNNKIMDEDANFKDKFHGENVFFEIGDIILHSIFGKGLVLNVYEDSLLISFSAPFGNKKINKRHKSITRINN